jgi:hypothetical protein
MMRDPIHDFPPHHAARRRAGRSVSAGMPAPADRRRLRRRARLCAIALLGLGLAACPPRARGPALLGDDALLTAPDSDVLAERLALVTAGRYQDAHAQWARRALLPPEPTALPGAGEEEWSREIQIASTALAERGPTARGLERLARAYSRAGWYREAHVVLERAAALDPLSAAGTELRNSTATLTRFAAGADSIVTAARARGGGEAAPAARDIEAFAGRLGLSLDTLRARRLHLGLRPPPPGGGERAVELSVIAHHEGPFAVRIATAAVTARRVILDDDALAATAGEGPDWDPGSFAVVEDGTLLAYHHRSDLRRAAARLYRDLERRGGRPPDAPADASLGAFATALRLRAAAPFFDRARAQAPDRTAARRDFARAVLAARMAQVETAGARFYLDHAAGLAAAPEAAARRRLLAVLRHAPAPRLALADAADRAAQGAADGAPDAEARAARAILEELRVNATIGEEELRARAGALD